MVRFWEVGSNFLRADNLNKPAKVIDLNPQRKRLRINTLAGLFALSGRTMALCGLRMMPRFPSPSLKFRTAGFPRYGFKAGISDAAFPARWFAIALRTLCCHRFSLLCVRDDALTSTSVQAVSPLYPRGPRSGPGYSVPVHQRLLDPIRPTRRHILISPSRGLYEMPSLCMPLACLGNPRLVLSFHR